MKKEELKNLKDWCIGMETLINLISTHKKRVPESVELITEQPADKAVHVYSGIEKIAAALKEPMHFNFNPTFYEKTISYNGVTFFQIGFYVSK